jgi:chromosome segregation ATPase
MDSDTVQRNFSKYISIHIDTWKKHILKRYESELPQKISELNEKIKSMELHISETEQKNKNIEQSITSKEDEIDKIKFTNEKLKNLLNSKNEKLIEKE